MKKYAAEFAGTFALVFVGTGAAVVNEISKGAVTQLGIAAAFGLVVFTIIYTLSSISGSHVNPAVTVALAVNNHFPYKQVIPYIISQATGGLLASYFLRLLFPTSLFLGGTLPSGTAMQSFILELLLTFVLMLVILQAGKTLHNKKIVAPAVIGGVVFLEAFYAGPICGASMNPVRSFTPAAINNHWQYLWIYLTAPFIGALTAVVVFKIVKK